MIFFKPKRPARGSKGSLLKKLFGLWLMRRLWRSGKQKRGFTPQRWAIAGGVLSAASLAAYFATRPR
jgi:hypothetical protein